MPGPRFRAEARLPPSSLPRRSSRCPPCGDPIGKADRIIRAVAAKEKLPGWVEPMLAKPGQVPESRDGDWAYEVKWDGVRVLGWADHGKWKLQSRRHGDVTARY